MFGHPETPTFRNQPGRNLMIFISMTVIIWDLFKHLLVRCAFSAHRNMLDAQQSTTHSTPFIFNLSLCILSFKVISVFLFPFLFFLPFPPIRWFDLYFIRNDFSFLFHGFRTWKCHVNQIWTLNAEHITKVSCPRRFQFPLRFYTLLDIWFDRSCVWHFRWISECRRNIWYGYWICITNALCSWTHVYTITYGP